MARFELPRWGRDLHLDSAGVSPKTPPRNRIEADSAQRVSRGDRSRPAAEGFSEYSIERDNDVRSGSNTRGPIGDSSSKTTSAAADPYGPEEEPGHRCPLDDIADALRLLTYGEMLELAEAMWKVNPQGSDITESNLPDMLYRWSTSRSIA